ncbi:MAG: hypothetical protein IJR87_12620 [Bacteroidaceae bacterium]|nr:hypothetical protein [Bacteroidaceae bacterium]
MYGKRTVLLLLTCLLSFSVIGKKKTEQPQVVKMSTLYKQANLAIKASANQPAAEKALLDALQRTDITNKDRARIYFHAARLQENLNGLINRQAYLKKAPYDTAQFFNTLLVMYQHLEHCDSVDAIPNEKGKVHTSFTGSTRALRQKHRRNILNGGKFFLSKANYDQAYNFFDYYYRYSSNQNDTILPQVATWAALCGYLVNNPNRTLRYIDEALLNADSASKPILQEYKARSYLQLNKEPSWVATLDEGLRMYPRYNFFFVNKEDYLYQHRMFKEGQSLADSLIQVAGDSALYWFAKSRMTLAENNYEKCIEFSDSTIARDPNYVDAYYNKGISYLNLAVIAEETACNDLTDPKCLEDRKTIQGFYQKAKPCMEMVRKLQPKEMDRWGSALYRIYLHLNMGAEFDEIEKLLKPAQ